MPSFIDALGSTIAYILPSQIESKTFSVINVGVVEDDSRELS